MTWRWRVKRKTLVFEGLMVMCLFFSVKAEDNKDFVKQDDKTAFFNQSTDCGESSLRMGRLVMDGIDTVLHQTNRVQTTR
jgi:hypothetical protein